MKTLLLALALLASQNTFGAARLTLNDYLDQVEQGSPAIASARLHSEGGPLRAGGAEVLTAPYLFGVTNSYHDLSETLYPASQGYGTQATGYTFGVGMNTPLGLNARYSWNTAFSDTNGLPVSPTGRYSSYNRLDATLNLVKNGFGSEIRARKELIRAGNSAQGFAGKFQWVARLAEAESAYWRLAFARQAVQVQKEILARADKLSQWANRRVSLQLGDRGDVLQAKANQEIRTLELTAAVEEERASARAFNLMRNREGESVPEAVGLPSLEDILRMQAPQKEGERLDVQAAAERTKAAQAQAQLDKDALKPSVDLVATYAWNGRDTQRNQAISEAFHNGHPYKAIGVNFTVPLDVPTWVKALRGANQEIEAAEYDLDQTRISESKDWSDLTSRLRDARSRLALANTIEGVQKDKFENERLRLQRGRTTTFQALTFEQDYAQAQLIRLRTQSEVLQLLAQMKSYRGNP